MPATDPSPASEPLGAGQRLLLAAFGLGYVPFMPGTIGSLGAALAVWGAEQALGATGAWVVAALLILYGVLVTLALAGRAHRRDGAGDPGWVVSDEVAGQALASAAAIGADAWMALAAFVAFRVLDVLKPPPIRRLERLPGGTGVLVDDLAAGIVAAALVVALRALGA